MLTHRVAIHALLGALVLAAITGCAQGAAPAANDPGSTVTAVPAGTQPAADAATQAETSTQPPDATETPPPDQATATQSVDAPQGAPSALPTKEIDVPMTVEPGASANIPADLLDQMKADAAQKAGVDVAQVEVVSEEQVTWNDGSLGCPKPGVMYTQALVPGYRVVLKIGATQYDYHASQRGGFIECKPTLKAPSSSKSPGDPTR